MSYEWQPPRDNKIDEAKQVLLDAFFPRDGRAVYYGRQLEVALEGTFFHWITRAALNELVRERQISFVQEKADHYVANFFWPLRHRYPRRQISETLSLIAEFSDPRFTSALGAQGEILADAGFARIGFRIMQSKVKEVDGNRWGFSDHDLDRLVERDGIRYGVEIKNQLGYIERDELETKLGMCRFFGVRPMFIARMMPKNYVNTVVNAGGFCLLLKNQHYPLLADELAQRVRNTLGLPVLAIRELPDTTMQRFERGHTKNM